MSKRRLIAKLVLASMSAVLLAGCGDWNRSRRPEGTLAADDPARQLQYEAIIQGTVAEYTYLENFAPLRVRGYGLVTGLGGQGSRNCPPSVREQIAKEIRRRRAATPQRERDLPTAERIIDSLDTAVVLVEAQIPPGAARNRTFDVFVRALDPDTGSIAGGILEQCDLRIFTDQGPAGSIEGRIWARAGGPVFVNPFAGNIAEDMGDASHVDPREGIIIGGGANVRPRTLNLVTVIDSYGIVRQIRDTINRRFPAEEPIADATSPTHVHLTIPKRYQERETRFIELVRHLPLNHGVSEQEVRSRFLISELTRPDAPHHVIALCLEGIGRTSLPQLQSLYTHPRPQVNYFAARTGLRLGDGLALDAVIHHAMDANSPFRRQAIYELGESDMRHATAATLRELLNDTDPRIRIEAYEALRRVDPSSIWQVVVGRNPANFLLEMTASEGEPLIYARRSGVRRIVLIGGDRMVCRTPLLYADKSKPVLVSAREGDPNLTIVRRDRNGNIVLGPIQGPLDIPPLIRMLGQNLRTNHHGKFEGLHLDYAVILDVLHELANNNAINAEFRWEEPSIEDVVGPIVTGVRPESEL